MSDYVRAKVIRYPLDDFYKKMKFDDEYELEEFFKKIDNNFGAYSSTPNTFTLQNTYGNHKSHIHLDYILNYEYGSDMGDYGIAYDLTEEQKEKWEEKFGKYLRDIDKDRFRLVEYCYYNGCDCPDYYEVTPKEEITDNDKWIL